MEVLDSLKKEIEDKKIVYLNLKVIPNSSYSKLEKMKTDVLKLKIKEMPEKGRANLAVIDFFKNSLKSLKLEIKISSGKFSNFKKLIIKLQK